MRALRNCDFCGDQAVGTFEIVPEELDPTEAERRRAVLCESCKERLATLIEPLLDHATDGQTNTGTASEADVAEEPPDTGGVDEGLIGADSSGPLLGDSSTEAAESDAESNQTTAEENPDTGDADDSQDSAAGSQTPDRSQQQDSRPDNYGKVLKLLRNREFPMSREEVVTIATSAYQLDSRNVQAIIDESVERGEFVEANGQLEQR